MLLNLLKQFFILKSAAHNLTFAYHFYKTIIRIIICIPIESLHAPNMNTGILANALICILFNKSGR